MSASETTDLERIRKILLHDWDPIGVRDVPEASDEYDRYAMEVLAKVKSGADLDELANYLEWVVTELMGMRSNPGHSRRIADRVLELGEHQR